MGYDMTCPVRRNHNPEHRIFNMSNTTGTSNGAETTYLSVAIEVTLFF